MNMEGDLEEDQDFHSENGQSIIQSTEKEDTLLDHMEICISECEKRETGALNYRDFYTVYLIETKVTDSGWTGAINRLGSIWRRYSEFEALRNYLVATHPYLVVPPLPEKKFDTVDRGGEKRRGSLETFLLRCSSHPVLSSEKQLMGFIQQEEGWRETIKEAGYLELAENKLKSLSLRVLRPDRQFEAYRNYSGELRANVANMLRLRGKVGERLIGMHRLHAAYGKVLSEWSGQEERMGDSLQKAGHYLDSLAASIDTALEEEDVLLEQLKEYQYFADGMAEVCASHEALQAVLERSQEQVEACRQQRDQIYKGRGSLVSRLFGSVDTDEVRELKCQALDKKIEESSAEVDQAQANLEKFTTCAVADIERFQRQKVTDLRETLANFATLQAKMCRKDLQTWKHIRDCFDAIP